MTNVLFLTQVLPYPLDSGAKFRAYYVLRQLAATHAITLVSFVRDDDPPEALDHLRGICAAVHTVPMRRSRLHDARALLKAALTGRSAIIVRDEVPEMARLLRRLVRQTPFDIIHADQTSMVQYALGARRQSEVESRKSKVESSESGGGGQARRSPRLVLDAHNALYRIPERMAEVAANPVARWGYRREARALQRYEAAAYRRFDHVVFVTEIDRQELLAEGPRSDVRSRKSRVRGQDSGLRTSDFGLSTSVIPICVDPTTQPLLTRRPHPHTIVHVGTMFWPPNVEGVLWFGHEVFPRVLLQVPEARFVVVGKNPPQAVQDLVLQVRNVNVMGYVPDPAPYLAEAAVFIVPLHAGGGMRVKIVDAWCWGVPIASTTVGAEGIDVRDGENILVADDPQALADAIVRVLRNPALGDQLRRNGRAWVEQAYNWRTIYPAWDDVYDSVLTQRRKGAEGVNQDHPCVTR